LDEKNEFDDTSERVLSAAWQSQIFIRLENGCLPVTSISAPEPYWTKDGASLWIGLYLVVWIGPRSSMGSPITLMILPSVSGPTGTMMGLPVSNTAWPRTSPSVESKAIVRTLFPPKCWATSKTKRAAVPYTSSALRIGGRAPSNCTSTTAPMTWEIFPVPLAVENIPKEIKWLSLSFLAIADI